MLHCENFKVLGKTHRNVYPKRHCLHQAPCHFQSLSLLFTTRQSSRLRFGCIFHPCRLWREPSTVGLEGPLPSKGWVLTPTPSSGCPGPSHSLRHLQGQGTTDPGTAKKNAVMKMSNQTWLTNFSKGLALLKKYLKRKSRSRTWWHQEPAQAEHRGTTGKLWVLCALHKHWERTDWAMGQTLHSRGALT